MISPQRRQRNRYSDSLFRSPAWMQFRSFGIKNSARSKEGLPAPAKFAPARFLVAARLPTPRTSVAYSSPDPCHRPSSALAPEPAPGGDSAPENPPSIVPVRSHACVHTSRRGVETPTVARAIPLAISATISRTLASTPAPAHVQTPSRSIHILSPSPSLGAPPRGEACASAPINRAIHSSSNRAIQRVLSPPSSPPMVRWDPPAKLTFILHFSER